MYLEYVYTVQIHSYLELHAENRRICISSYIQRTDTYGSRVIYGEQIHMDLEYVYTVQIHTYLELYAENRYVYVSRVCMYSTDTYVSSVCF